MAVKSEQRDQAGVLYNNIIWDDGVERTHCKSMVAFDRAELSRFGDYNRACFIIEAQAMLHYWYHIGRPHDRVPNLTFEPLNPPRFAKYIFNLAREFSAEIATLLPEGDIPPSFGI